MILNVAIALVFISACPVSQNLLLNSARISSGGKISAPSLQYVYDDSVYQDGAPMVWRGAGGSYLFHADDYEMAWQNHLSQIQEMGLNTVRLAFAFNDSGINPEYGVPSADVMDYSKLDWVLDFLDRHGIKAILDCHNWNDMIGDFGSQKLIDDWVDVALRYRGDSRVAAYELFNEPGPITWSSSVSSTTDVLKAYADLTDAIRKVDPNHIVVWPSLGWLAYAWDLDKFPTVLQSYSRPNTVMTVHRWTYRTDDKLQVWNPKQVSYVNLDYLVKARNALKTPFWLGEFGSGSPFDSSNTEWLLINETLLRCEEQGIGWNLWMDRVAEDILWQRYLPFFPLKAINASMIRSQWINPVPTITDYMLDQQGTYKFDKPEPFKIELHDNGDYATFRPGITLEIIILRRLPDQTYEIMNRQILAVESITTIRNEEGTQAHPGDWDTRVFALSY